MEHRITIEIAKVLCSVAFEGRSLSPLFEAVISDYTRWGFCVEGTPQIYLTIRDSIPQVRMEPRANRFVQELEYDSIRVCHVLDVETFTGHMGYSILQADEMTPVRVIEMAENLIFEAFLLYFLTKRLGTFIHSSGISDGRRGYIFAGQRGAGKSTVAKLAAPRKILCDELVLLRKTENGRMQVFGTPFIGESEAVNEGIECRGIFFLNQGSTNELLALKRVEGAAELLKEGIIGAFIYLDAFQHLCPRAGFFDLLLDLLESVPCFRMKFKKDESFWEMIDGRSV